MAHILVRANNPGYAGRYRAGDRHWENGVEHTVEVVDDPPGGRPLSAREPLDPETGLSDMTRISRAGLAELKTDSHLSVLEGDNAVTSAAASQAVARVRELAAELEERKLSEETALAMAAEVEQELKAAAARIDELEKANLALKAEASRLADEVATLKAAAKEASKKAPKADAKASDKAVEGASPTGEQPKG